MKVFFFFLALCGIGFAVSVADQEDSKARLSLSNDPFFGSIFRKIKGFFTGNKTPKTPNRNTSNGKHKGCLYAQNVFRRLHRNTPDMVWDANLASQAQSWAEHLLNLGYMKHAKVRGQGENIYTQTSSWGPATCAQAAHAWYEEIKNPGYNFNNVGGSFSGTGHFTQLVWDTSVRTGVGIASRTRNGKTKTFIVARYAPQGNFYMRGRKVEAYQQHVHRRKAGARTPTVYQIDPSLCRDNNKSCQWFKNNGWCQSRPRVMKQNCAKKCGFC